MNNDQRLYRIDTLRGLDLISMILYHALWDLVFIFNADIPWYRETPGFIWQQSICWIFILLSGFSFSLGHHPVKRGLTVSVCGVIVTVATIFFLPEDPVYFGILTFMGAAMLITVLIDRIPFDKRFLLCLSACLFLLTRNIGSGYLGAGSFRVVLSRSLYRNPLTAFLGFPFPSFHSSDYFPLLPWYFLYLTGYSLNGMLLGSKTIGERVRVFLAPSICPPLEFIGRHTLIIYMLHQPVIMGILTILPL